LINDTKAYGESFYAKHRLNNAPSSFAVYVVGKYLKKGSELLELGCGNGRDSVYFSSKGMQVTAVDQVQEEIDFLNDLNYENVEFISKDFTELESNKKYDYIYSRFSLHAIDRESEQKLLLLLPSLLLRNGLFLLEARSKKDISIKKEFGNDHYRRYIDFIEIQEQLTSNNMKIIMAKEERGLAKYKKEDPWIIRIIAVRA